MSLTIEVPIDKLSFVALAKSSSMEEGHDVSVTVRMGVDGGARSSMGDGRLAMFQNRLCFQEMQLSNK